MLVFILCSILMLAPALQGVWDFRVQFLFEAAVFMTGGFWLFRESISGRPPAFLTDKTNIPLLCAAFFSLLSALLSPVRALVMPEWWTFAAGLCILVLGNSLKVRDLRLTDFALRISAWLIVLLSLYQAVILKSSDISASLANPNSLALFVLMVLPLAIKWKDLFLLGAAIIILVWTQSAAALLALLVAAGFYAKDNMKAADLKKNWWLLIVLASVTALAVSQLELRSFFDRMGWWRAALGMCADRPALGYGPGSFAYVYPAYHSHSAAGVATTYVHNYYLEFLAENGVLSFLFWAWAVAFRLKAVRGLKKYALIAALVHSVVDFGLAVPANFFIFCYLLSEPKPLESAVPVVRTGNKLPIVLIALGLACFIVLCGVFSSQLKLERLRVRALSDLYAGDYPRAEAALKEAARIAPDNPLVPGMLGQIRMRAGFAEKDRNILFSAAVELERALILNPYNAAAWRDLERLYAGTGERKLLEGIRKRKEKVFK